MDNIVLFGGTNEGRKIAEYFAGKDIRIAYCVATEYGKNIVKAADNIRTYDERMNMQQMEAFLRKESPVLCVDATHPYAVLVTQNIQNVCDSLGIQYIRVVRMQNDDYVKNLKDNEQLSPCVYEVSDVKEAVGILKQSDGNIFITTGSKELHEYTAITDYKNRCFARVLPTAAVMQKCFELGFEGRNVIGMQGPFSGEINVAMLKHTGAKWLVTKNSGKEGGFSEKCEAAAQLGISLIIIKRPDENENVQKLSISDTIQYICNNILNRAGKRIYIVGMGPGDPKLLSADAIDAIKESSLLIGAKRMIDIASKVCDINSKDVYVNYREDEIFEYINSVKDNQIAILYSGDITFYSGAEKMLKKLDGFNIKKINGLSSMDYFFKKLSQNKENTFVTSCHGNRKDLLPAIKEHRSVAALLGDVNQVSTIACGIIENNLSCNITVGSNLSYPDEKIVSGGAKDFVDFVAEPLSIILIEKGV